MLGCSRFNSRALEMLEKMNQTTKLLLSLIIGVLIGAGGMAIFAPPAASGTTTYTITTAGSTTVYPLSQEWAARFNADYPNFVVNPSTGGSGLGQSQVADGLIDIGASSSYPKR